MHPFTEAWDEEAGKPRILPTHNQSFRRGWNAALVAVADRVHCGEITRDEIFALEIDVQT